MAAALFSEKCRIISSLISRSTVAFTPGVVHALDRADCDTPAAEAAEQGDLEIGGLEALDDAWDACDALLAQPITHVLKSDVCLCL